MLKNWIEVERWTSDEWLLAIGWWQGAFEIWLGRRIIRFARRAPE